VNMLAGHGDVVTAGRGHRTHRHDHLLGRAVFDLRRGAVAQFAQALVDVVASGNRAAGTVDPHHHGFDRGVFRGLVDLTVGVAHYFIHQHAVDLNHGNLVVSVRVAGVELLGQVRPVVRGAAAEREDPEEQYHQE